MVSGIVKREGLAQVARVVRIARNWAPAVRDFHRPRTWLSPSGGVPSTSGPAPYLALCFAELAAGVVAALCRTHSREPVVCTHLTRPSTCPSQSWVVPSTAALEISPSPRSTCPSVVAAAALPRLWVVSRARHRPTPTADPRCLGTPPACDRESRDPAFQPTAHSACMDPPLPPPHAPGSQVAAHVRGVVEAHARFLQLNFFITKVRLYVAA